MWGLNSPALKSWPDSKSKVRHLTHWAIQVSQYIFILLGVRERRVSFSVLCSSLAPCHSPIKWKFIIIRIRYILIYVFLDQKKNVDMIIRWTKTKCYQVIHNMFIGKYSSAFCKSGPWWIRHRSTQPRMFVTWDDKIMMTMLMMMVML